ncbi:hypothetical protein ACWCZ5_34835 [Streptomyces sp. NPDC001667]
MTSPVPADNTFLTYTLRTDPDPLTSSRDGSPSLGTLLVSVGAIASAPAWCESITIALPLGTGDRQLAANDAAALNRIETAVQGGGTPGGWTASARTSGGKRLITFTPYNPVRFDGTFTPTLVMSRIQINKTQGTPPIEITEKTSVVSQNYTPKTTTQFAQKFPPGFRFSNLHPDAIVVKNGERVRLSWFAQNADCTVFYNNTSERVGTATEWISPPLTTHTGFMVQARSTNITGTSTLLHTLTTTVLVALADLDTGHLDTRGTTTTHGPLNVLGETDLFREQTFNLKDLPQGNGSTTTGNYLLQAPTDGILCLQFSNGTINLQVDTTGNFMTLGQHAAPNEVTTFTKAMKRGTMRFLVPRTATGWMQWYALGSGRLDIQPEPRT